MNTCDRPNSFRPPRPAWLALMLLCASIAAMLVRPVSEPPALVGVLNHYFLALPALFIAYYSGKSFLTRGLPELLLLGGGALFWGAAGVASNLVAYRDQNLGITLYHNCVWLSAACHLAGAALLTRPHRAFHSPGLWLGMGCVLVVGAVGLVVVLAFHGWLPPLFVKDKGVTLVQQVLLGSATAMFAFSAALLRTVNRPFSSPFAYWYTLGLLLIAAGLLALMLQFSCDIQFGFFMGHATLFLSGICMLLAALACPGQLSSPGVVLGRAQSAVQYRYAAAIVIVFAAAGVRLAFFQALGNRTAFFTFFPAVMLACLYGGWRASLLASLTSVILGIYFAVDWMASFNINNSTDTLTVALFLLSCAMITYIIEATRRLHVLESGPSLNPGGHSNNSKPPTLRFTPTTERLRAMLPVNVAFAIALALLTAVIWFSYRNIASAVESDRWEDHTFVVIEELDQLQISLKDTELTERGFLITGEKQYLEPYHKARNEVFLKLHDLKHLIEINSPQHQQSLQEIDATVSRMLVALQEAVELRQAEGFKAIEEKLFCDEGRVRIAQMNEVCARINQLKNEHAKLQNEHTKAKFADMRGVIQTGVAGCLLSFAVLFFVFRILRKEIAQRTRAETEVIKHRDHLHELVKERTLELEQEIIERKRAEEKAEQSHCFAHGILDNLSDHVAIVDEAGKIIAVNAAWRRFAEARGLPDAAVGINFLGVCEEAQGKDSEDARQVARALRRLLREKQGEFRYIYPCHDEEQRWFQLQAHCFQQGSQTFLIQAHQNITEMKLTEQALRESEKKHRLLFENTLDAVLLTMPAGRIVTTNRAARELFGMTEAEIIQAGWEALSDQDDPRYAALTQGQQWNEKIHGEANFVRKDGTRFCAELSTVLLDDEAKAFVILKDITERRRAEELLRQRVEEVEKVMLAAPVAIWVAHDPQCYRMTGNRMANEIYEIYEMESSLGRPPGKRRFFREGRELRPEELPMQLAASTGMEVRDAEMEVVLASGKRLIMFGHAIPLWDSNGKVRGCIGAFLDLTERKRGEELLQSQAKHLEVLVQERTAKLQEAIGELEHFSYTITHDMRAPLRAMRGYGDLLLEQNERLSPASQKFIARIRSGAGRMDRLITDALDYSKLVRHEFDLTPIDCATLLHEMIESYPQYQESKAAILIEGTIPPIMGNEAALTQCFSNLLDNAIKFVAPGQKPLVRVRAEEHGDSVQIWFEDNGIGISEEGRDRIFVMFQRLSTTHEGTGIGLALVRKAAERMSGKVGVESKCGEGSRFWLEFKRA